MQQVNRRSFLAASVAFAARPALGATSSISGSFDAVIVGAGAAGIAAARRLAAAGRRYVVIEATDHVGGRCVTDMKSFGVPFDRGARWIYLPDTNPLIKAAPRRSDIYPAPASQKVRIGRRYAREGELEDLLTAQVRTIRAIDDMARKADIPSEQAVPKDLGEWGGTIEFMLGPYNCAKELAQVSSFDFARAAERRSAAFCKQGLGALLAALAQGLNVQLSTPAKTINTRGGITVETSRGDVSARSAIVTVPTAVVSSGGLRFSPDLGHQQIDAFGRMSLGSYDHIALEFSGNPLGLESDDLVFEKSANTHTAALLANISGTTLCTVDVAGAFGRDLSAQGEAAMFDFAAEWLSGLYGPEVKRAITRKHATRWNHEPFTLGAWSAAVPGSQFARRQLLEPIAGNVWYAGEAAHETLWGTVGGAWESGERVADAIVRQLGPLRPQAPAESEVKSKRRERTREERREREGSESGKYWGTPSIVRDPQR